MTHDSKHTPQGQSQNGSEGVQPASRVTRFLARAAQVIAVCFFIVALTLMSGVLERCLVPALSQRLLGARVCFRIDGWKPLHLRGLRVQEDDATPFLCIDTLSVHYQLFPVHIKSLSMRGVRARLDGSNPERPNYAFLLPYFEDGEGSDFSRWLPRRIVASEISLYADMPDWSASISELNVAAEIEAMNRLTATLSSDAARAGWQSDQNWPDIPLSDGKVSATLTLSPESLKAQAQIQLPDFLVLDGAATLATTDATRLELTVNEIRLDGPVFGMLVSLYAPAAVAFDTAVIAPLQLTVALTDTVPAITDAHLDAQIAGFVLGDRAAPWYVGNLGIEVAGEHGAVSQATWTATLNQGQRISGTFATDDDGIGLTASLREWSEAQLLALWPEPFAHWKDYLPELQQLNGTVDCRIAADKAIFAATISPTLYTGTTTTLDVTGKYDLQQGDTVMQARTTLGAGHCTLDGGLRDGELTATITADAASASEVLVLSPWPTLGAIRASLTGKAAMTLDADGHYVFDVEADAVAPGYGDWMLPESLGPVNISGSVVVASDFSTITAGGALRLPDDGATLNVSALHYDIGQNSITSRFTGSATLSPLGAAFGFDDLWGDMTVEGAFGLQDWTLGELAPLNISFESLGYGNLSIPYRQTLSADAPFRFDISEMSAVTGAVQITLGGGTKLVTDALQIAPGNVAATAAIFFETDFTPIVAKQYLAAAEGQLSVAVEDFRYDAAGITGTATWQCEAPRLILPDKLADLRGLTTSGTVTLHPAPDGAGTLLLEELIAGGASVHKTSGNMRIVGNSLILENATFNLFGGGVVARMEVRPFEAGLPVIVSGNIRNMDLQIFTNEFEPPSLVLTGRVNGSFDAGFTAQQLTMLDVDLEAFEEFSMNRDMVEQLLMRQYVGEMTGGRRMERMLASVIGKDEQRKFDRARMNLGLEDGRISGYAKLESEELNLTIDIKADPLALLEALRTQ